MFENLVLYRPREREEQISLCDTCLYSHSCERSDAGISWANHSVCYGYVSDENEKGGDEE